MVFVEGAYVVEAYRKCFDVRSYCVVSIKLVPMIAAASIAKMVINREDMQ
jgi:hypothetical protein